MLLWRPQTVGGDHRSRVRTVPVRSRSACGGARSPALSVTARGRTNPGAIETNTQMNAPSSARKTWHFFRAGGFDQVHLHAGADLAALDRLDQKLWVALACPTRGLEFDSRTLELLDTDKDGRIRAPEVIAACQWACRCLKNPDDLLKGADALPLTALNDATPEGKQLLASARQILVNLGKPEAATLSVADTVDPARIFAHTQFNGDGIVPVQAAEDAPTRAVLTDILNCLGAETDRSGQPGVTRAKVDAFFTAAHAHVQWRQQAETDPTILPLGEATARAAAAYQAVKPKVDDYFTRGRLAAFDERALAALNRPESEFLALAAKELSSSATELAGFPLARIEPNRPLPLTEGVNPAWADALATLRAEAVQPLLGDRAALSAADWQALGARLAPYQSWMAAKAGAAVEPLGLPRLREILASRAQETIVALIAQDQAREPEANAIAAVERLVRYHRDLYQLLNNFVAFRTFYARHDLAIFQVGTLYLDQRSCELCLAVDDPGRHAALAGLAGTYLAYCDCVRKSTGEKRQIVAAFTDGDADNLMVGRNGLFYDRQGRDWDATITKIVDNPISIRQAFWAPYKKFVRMIEEQVAKRAAAADAASTAKLEGAATAVAQADKPKPAPEPKKLDVGVVAALGVGVGALGTAAGYFLGLFKGLSPWQAPLVILGLMLLISTPSMVIAWLKLRRRNLGPILDANGWAVNAKAKLNVPFGRTLTGVAKLPPGARRDLADPYREKPSPWPKLIVLALVLWLAYTVLDRRGYLHQWTQGRFGQPAAATTAPPQAP